MKRIKTLIALVLVFLCASVVAGCPTGEHTQPTALTKTQIINKVKYGVVSVADIGSGVVVEASEDGCIIVTNYHVIASNAADKTAPRVKFWQGDYTYATILGYCKDYDVAVLKTNYVPVQLYVFNLDTVNDNSNDIKSQKGTESSANSAKNAELGQEILSLGYVDLQLCAYDGIISCTPKLAMVNNLGEDVSLFLIETTAIAPMGTSGGACFDLSGNLIALNAFAYTENGVSTGLSYKIPASIVRAVVKKIVAADAAPFPLATGFSISKEGEISLIYLGCLTVRVENELLIVVNSDLPRYSPGSVIDTVNGKLADTFTFISEVILTGNIVNITTKTA